MRSSNKEVYLISFEVGEEILVTYTSCQFNYVEKLEIHSWFARIGILGD